MVPGCFKILLDAQRRVNNGVGEVKAIIIVYSRLNPHRSLREPLGVKGVRQSVVITNNPSSIDPNLGEDDVITMISRRQPQKGQMVIIRGSMPPITETRRGFESVPETEIQALPLTRPSLTSSVIASSLHSISSCSRATCHFTRAHWATGSSTSSLLATIAV